MAFWYKENGIWKQENKIYTKVSGAWKEAPYAYIKIGGAWKRFHGEPYVPAGAITLLNNTVIPSGWTQLYSGSPNLLRGWNGTAGDIGVAAGGNTPAFASAASANHTGTAFPSKGAGVTYPVGYSDAGAAGSHAHTITLAGGSYPARFRVPIIQANANYTELPPHALVMAAGLISGLSLYSITDYMVDGYNNTPAIVAAATSTAASTNTAGAHDHVGGGSFDVQSGYDSAYTNLSAGGHAHSFTIAGISWNMYRKCVLALTKASAMSPEAGMIFGWLGTVAPPGFAFCDGGNGTVDLRNDFISLHDGQSPGTRLGTGLITASYTTNSAGSHNHVGTIASMTSSIAAYHSNNIAHTHAGAMSVAYDYFYTKLAFIQATF